MQQRKVRTARARAGAAFCLASALAIGMLGAARPATAQQPSVGLGLGLLDMPRDVGPCEFGTRVDALGVDLRAAVPLSGRWSVEGRAGGNLPLESFDCITVLLPRPDGAYVRRESPGKEAGYSSDLRLRFQMARGVVLAAGAGWLWGPHAPYLAVSPGLRVGGRVRFLLDADGLLGHFPYDLITEQWQSGVLVGELGRQMVHEWHAVVGVRAGVELRLGGAH